MTKYQIMLLKGMLHGYAIMILGNTKDEYTDSPWYKQAEDVHKYLNKRRPDTVASSVHDVLEAKKKELIELDATYFGDRLFSSYACMILILQHLVVEERDTEVRGKFLHYNFNKILAEMGEMFPEVEVDSSKYVGRLIKSIEEVKI